MHIGAHALRRGVPAEDIAGHNIYGVFPCSHAEDVEVKESPRSGNLALTDILRIHVAKKARVNVNRGKYNSIPSLLIRLPKIILCGDRLYVLSRRSQGAVDVHH